MPYLTQYRDKWNINITDEFDRGSYLQSQIPYVLCLENQGFDSNLKLQGMEFDFMECQISFYSLLGGVGPNANTDTWGPGIDISVPIKC